MQPHKTFYRRIATPGEKSPLATQKREVLAERPNMHATKMPRIPSHHIDSFSGVNNHTKTEKKHLFEYGADQFDQNATKQGQTTAESKSIMSMSVSDSSRHDLSATQVSYAGKKNVTNHRWGRATPTDPMVANVNSVLREDTAIMSNPSGFQSNLQQGQKRAEKAVLTRTPAIKDLSALKHYTVLQKPQLETHSAYAAHADSRREETQNTGPLLKRDIKRDITCPAVKAEFVMGESAKGKEQVHEKPVGDRTPHASAALSSADVSSPRCVSSVYKAPTANHTERNAGPFCASLTVERNDKAQALQCAVSKEDSQGHRLGFEQFMDVARASLLRTAPHANKYTRMSAAAPEHVTHNSDASSRIDCYQETPTSAGPVPQAAEAQSDASSGVLFTEESPVTWGPLAQTQTERSDCTLGWASHQSLEQNLQAMPAQTATTARDDHYQHKQGANPSHHSHRVQVAQGDMTKTTTERETVSRRHNIHQVSAEGTGAAHGGLTSYPEGRDRSVPVSNDKEYSHAGMGLADPAAYASRHEGEMAPPVRNQAPPTAAEPGVHSLKEKAQFAIQSTNSHDQGTSGGGMVHGSQCVARGEDASNYVPHGQVSSTFVNFMNSRHDKQAHRTPHLQAGHVHSAHRSPPCIRNAPPDPQRHREPTARHPTSGPLVGELH